MSTDFSEVAAKLWYFFVYDSWNYLVHELLGISIWLWLLMLVGAGVPGCLLASLAFRR